MDGTAPPRLGLLIVSDRRSAGEPDLAGPALTARLVQLLLGAQVQREIVPDELGPIRERLVTWSDRDRLDAVFTSGGTGFGPRDVTPEATLTVIERPAPGLVVAMIAAGLTHTPHAMLSRPAAGIRGRTLIVNLPGSPAGALEALEALAPALPHAIALLRAAPDAEFGHQASTA